MDLFTTAVPTWVSILFLIAICITVFMIARLAKHGALAAGLKSHKIYLIVLAFYGLFFLCVSLMTFAGIFQENTLPPKILLFTAMPLLLFYLLVVSRLKIFKQILKATPIQSLVSLHQFRFIGVFFFIISAYGAIPTKFAYLAGIGDIAIALISIFVVRAITSKKPYAKPLTIAWNILGLLDIVSVIASAIIITRLSIDTGSVGLTRMGEFPFCFIPAFAPATIIFLHMCIFQKSGSLRKHSKLDMTVEEFVAK